MSVNVTLNVTPVTGLAALGWSATVDIEALLVWTYRVQLAHVVSEAGVSLSPREAGLEFKLAARLAQDGSAADHLVPRNPYSYRCDVLPPDAERVHACVSSLPALARKLVIDHALRGARPGWGEGVAPLEAVRVYLNAETPSGKRRTHRVFYAGQVAAEGPLPEAVRIHYALPACCPFRLVEREVKNRHPVGCWIDYVDRRALIEAAREAYALWWEAVDALRVALSGRLERHEPARFAAPRAPWRQEA